MKKLLTVIPALALALSLSACSNDESTGAKVNPSDTPSSSTPSEAPSNTPTEEPTEEPSEDPTEERAGDTQTFDTGDYTTTVPSSWEDATAEASGSSAAGAMVQLAYREPVTEGASFATNANAVKVAGGPELKGDALVTAFQKEIKSVVDSSKYMGKQDVDGETGYVFKSKLATGGLDITLYQVQAYHKGASYVFTVTTTEAAEGKAAFIQAVADWSWAS